MPRSERLRRGVVTFVVGVVIAIVLIAVLRGVTDSDNPLIVGVACGLGVLAGLLVANVTRPDL